MSVIQTSLNQQTSTPAWKKLGIAKWTKLRKYLQHRRQLKIDRLAFQHLLLLDDHMLHDIGYQRQDIDAANALPLGENAAIAVYQHKQAIRRQNKN
ncbi:MAG: DUF1127 domain-containing protein [Rhizobiaceae bacterium]|nr:DUF1127 domain-containing protein [Rhizobiaceae bacterium]